jgi:hypothetical protein
MTSAAVTVDPRSLCAFWPCARIVSLAFSIASLRILAGTFSCVSRFPQIGQHLDLDDPLGHDLVDGAAGEIARVVPPHSVGHQVEADRHGAPVLLLIVGKGDHCVLVARALLAGMRRLAVGGLERPFHLRRRHEREIDQHIGH